MRQIIITISLAILAFAALLHLASGQAITSTAARHFKYNNFTAADEQEFGVGYNPSFGPETLIIVFYDQYSIDERMEVGSVWYKRRAQLESFNSTFTIRMSNLSHTGVGNPDGFAFVVQNHRVNAFGIGAGGIGYGTTPDFDDFGIRRSVAVEFDTHMDENLGDPNSNHISVHHTSPDRIHNSAHENDALIPPGTVTNVPPFAGFTRKYTVRYINQELSVFIDDSTTPAYQATLDIPSIIGLNSSGAFVGLTASCMGTCETIEVLNWQFNYMSVFDGTKSFVSRFSNSSVAGRAASVTIQGVDTNGYLYQTGGDLALFSAAFAPVNVASNVQSPTINVVDRGDGTYTLSYTALTAGTYDMTIYYNSNPISGMPLRLTVSPASLDATRSDVSGNFNGGVAGQTLNLTITARDSFGNLVPNNNPPATFTASFTNGGASATSTFMGNGTYLIQYMLTTARTYTMTVNFNGTNQQIRGSPFQNVVITPALPEPMASTGSGSGVTGGTAGDTLRAVVVVRDRFQNNITTGMPPNYQLMGVWDKAAAGNNVSFVLQADGTYSGTYAINTAGAYRLTVMLGPQGQLGAINGSPFPVSITARTTTAPDQSIATGAGLTSAAAGVNASFIVQARDQFGNDIPSSDASISVSFSDDSGVPLQLASSATQNQANKGTFTVSYVPTVAVSTRVHVNLNGSPIKGSPFIVNVAPGALDPKNCFAEGLAATTTPKIANQFVIITNDHFNNRLRSGGATIDVTFKEMKSGATVTGSVQDLNNGAYNVGFTLTRSGVYNVTINANGVQIGKDAKYSTTVPSQGLGALGWALVILGVLALIAVVGGGAFWYLKYYKARSEYDEIGA